MKILYVENHKYFIEAVCTEFLSNNEVHDAPSVKQAIDAYDSEIYDLVLVDYDLDDGKGSEVISYIRSKDKNLPIIAVSSHDKGNSQMITVGANAVCKKINFRSINDVIDNIFNKNSK